jgi:hypothetical protein
MMAKLEVFSIKQVGTIQRVINMGMGQKWSKYQSHDTAFCSCSVLTVEFFKCTQLLTHTLLTGRRFDFFLKKKTINFYVPSYWYSLTYSYFSGGPTLTLQELDDGNARNQSTPLYICLFGKTMVS